MSAIWKLNKDYSCVNFSIRHLLVQVHGKFLRFELSFDENTPFENSLIKFSAETSSIDTGIKSRDKHLKTEDFFDSDKFPFIYFQSTYITRNDTEFTIHGDLAIKDITLPFKVYTSFLKPDPQHKSSEKTYLFDAQLSRLESGLLWNGLTGEGLPILSDLIKVSGSMLMRRKPVNN